jgi:hypothetical protein
LTRQAIERERAFAQLMLVAVGLAALVWIGFIIAAFCRRDGRKALRIFAAPFVIPVVIAIPVGAVLIVGAGVLIGLSWLFTTFPFLDPTYTIIALIVLWISIAWVKEYISNRKVFPHRIQRTSRITGQQTEIREIACSWAQLDRWDAGASMEEAFASNSSPGRTITLSAEALPPWFTTAI